MLFIYKSGIIKVNNKFRIEVMMATGAVFLVYLLSFASLNLLLDFDNFEKVEQYGATAYKEWFSAMGLLVTLASLYLEMLGLVAHVSSQGLKFNYLIKNKNIRIFLFHYQSDIIILD